MTPWATFIAGLIIGSAATWYVLKQLAKRAASSGTPAAPSTSPGKADKP